MAENQKFQKKVGARLKSIRIQANLSLQQMFLATGVSKGHIINIEAGTVNTGISYLGLYCDLFGIDSALLLDFNSPVPDEATLQQAVKKYIKSKGIDPAVFFKPGVTNIIVNKLLKTNYLNAPRFAKEIADYCAEKYKVTFTTIRISKVLDDLSKKKVIEKLASDKKSKYQYRKVQQTP